MAGASANRTLLFVAFIAFVDMCGLGLIIPVLPSLISGLSNTPVERAAELGGFLLFTYALMQFLFAPVIGGLSDRFGRRPILLVTLALLGIDYLVMALSTTLTLLFFGRAVSGIMGATWAAANSCVADLFDSDDRGRAFGILGAGGAAGFVMGPAIGGLLGQWGDRAPFFAAAALTLVGAAVGLFMLPESLPKERRRRFEWKRANPAGAVMQMRLMPVVIGLIVVIFLVQLAAQVQIAVWSYYTILKFGWTPLIIGLSIAYFGVLIAIAQGVLTGPIIARIGEKNTVVWGLLTAIPAYIIFAFAGAGWVMFVGTTIAIFANCSFPAMQALMTRAAPENAQGELQGAIASTMSMTFVIGPIVMTFVFGMFADREGIYFPGAPFILAAVLMGLAVLKATLTLRRV